MSNTTTIGGTTTNHAEAGYIIASPFTPSQGMTVSQLGANMYSFSSGAKLVLGLYADSSGLPGSKLGQTNEITVATGWNVAALQSNVTLTSGTQYWIASEHNSTAQSVYQASTGTVYYKAQTYSATMPSSFPSSPNSSTATSNYEYVWDPTSTPINISDSGSGSDTSATPNLTITETGSGSEAISSNVTFGVSDSGSGADSPVEEMDFLDN